VTLSVTAVPVRDVVLPNGYAQIAVADFDRRKGLVFVGARRRDGSVQHELLLLAPESTSTHADTVISRSITMGFSSSGRWAYASEGHPGIRLWFWDTSAPPSSLLQAGNAGHEGHIVWTGFSRDENAAFSIATNGEVRVWTLTNKMPGNLPTILEPERNFVFERAKNFLVAPDDAWLAYYLRQMIFRPIAKQTGQLGVPLQVWKTAIEDIGTDGNGTVLAAADQDGVVRVWRVADLVSQVTSPVVDIATKQDCSQVISGHRVYVSPDGRHVVSASLTEDCRALVLGIGRKAGETVVRPLGNLRGEIGGVIFSPDGRWLVAGSRDSAGELAVWDLTADDLSQPTAMLPVKGLFGTAALSKDHRWFAYEFQTEHGEKKFVIQRIEFLEKEAPKLSQQVSVGYDGRPFVPDATLFSPDGAWLATGMGHGRILLWRMNRQGPMDQPIILNAHDRGSGGDFGGLNFSHDGKLLVSWQRGQGALLAWKLDWNSNEAAPMTVGAWSERIAGAAFIVDSKKLLIGRAGGGLQIWSIDDAEMLRLACETAGRTLRSTERQQYLPTRYAYAAPCASYENSAYKGQTKIGGSLSTDPPK
jgi:WD40 repeat protein